VPEPTSKPELRVMLEWRAYPLWVSEEGGGVDNPDPSTIVGSPLAGELDRWAEDYDELWDPDDPRGPVFPTRDTELEFYRRGLGLARRLADEVGDRWAVRFQQADGGWVRLS
jgi:hypothetical protein